MFRPAAPSTIPSVFTTILNSCFLPTDFEFKRAPNTAHTLPSLATICYLNRCYRTRNDQILCIALMQPGDTHQPSLQPMPSSRLASPCGRRNPAQARATRKLDMCPMHTPPVDHSSCARLKLRTCGATLQQTAAPASSRSLHGTSAHLYDVTDAGAPPDGYSITNDLERNRRAEAKQA